MSDCVVVGAGIIGVSIAYRLADQGIRVALVDAGWPAGGTTGTSGALVGAEGKVPYEYHRLGVAGMAAMRRLNAEFPTSSWFHGTGHLEWAHSVEMKAVLDARVQRLTEWVYPVQILTPDHVMQTLEPDLIIPANVDEVVFFSDESIIYPHILIALLLRRLTSLGVSTHFGAGHAELAVRDGRIEGVRMGDGRTLAADTVVVAAGRWTQELLQPHGIKIPMVSPWDAISDALGFQVVTTQVPVDVRRMIRMPGLSIRPAGGGRLMLHGRPEERELNALGPESGMEWDRPLVPAPPPAHTLLDKAKRALRNVNHAQVQSATASVRSLTVDGLPAVGWAHEVTGLYMAVTHGGIALGPLLGELVTNEITNTESPLLATFRPDRFSMPDFAGRPRPMRDAQSATATTN